MLDPREAVPDAETEASDDKLEEVFERAIQRFNATVLPQQEQRALAIAARRFASIPGAQWEGDYGDAFANSIRLESNKVAMGLEKIVRDYRDNRIVPDFRPAGGESDQDTADTLDGLHRADSYHFKAQQARDNAFEEGAAGGFGAYRLTNVLADPYDKDSDAQRINPGLIIVDADQRVFFDGNSKLYDKSDARFCYVLDALTKDAFEEEYPEASAVSWPETRGFVRPSAYEWFTPDVVVIGEYYEVEDKSEKLLIFTLEATKEEQRHWSSEIDNEEADKLKALGWKLRTQVRKRKRVHKYTMSGMEVLKDHGLIAGDAIPVVPFYGKRWYIDNQERFRGYAQLKMDMQRLYNGQLSKIAEIAALAPREIPIFAREQMPSALAEQWGRQSVDRHAYALIEPLRNEDGSIVAPGPIGQIASPQMPATAAALLQIAQNDLTEDQQDPNQVVANTSADAMDIAATRVDAKSDIYLDNMRQTVEREGEIYLGMAKEVYFEPGRVVETMSEEGDDGEAELHKPVTDAQSKLTKVVNDFQSGKYKVIAAVTEATATRRDKTVKASVSIAQVAIQAQDMDLAQIALRTAVMNQDGEGMGDMQKWARQQLVTKGVVEPTDDEKKAMAEAQQQQQPDAQSLALTAQAKDFEASAQLKGAQTVKALTDAKLSQAKTVETLANAHETHHNVTAPQLPAANDSAPHHAAPPMPVPAMQPHHAPHPIPAPQIPFGAPRQTIRRGSAFGG
jgi:hypothetical protein